MSTATRIRGTADPADLLDTHYGGKPDIARRSRRRFVAWLGVGAWTAFVAVALWWLLLRANAGPQVWLIHEAPTRPGLSERARSLLSSDLGLRRAYPWILFGPYAALLALLVPLERGRFRWAVPLHLAACIAFVSVCQTIDARTRLSFAVFRFAKSKGPPNETETLRALISLLSGLRPGAFTSKLSESAR